MKKTIYIFYFLILFSHWIHSQIPGSFHSYTKEKTNTREHPLDFTKMILRVGFNPMDGAVKGQVEHHFIPLLNKTDSFFLDGPGIEIKNAWLDGTPVSYKISSQGITFFPSALQEGKSYKLIIDYEAHPTRGLYFIGWNDQVNTANLKEYGHTRQQIWTQGQGIDNRHWIPCFDEMNDKIISETYITFDKDFNVLSNGLLKEKKENKDNTITWHYAMSKPHASYLIMIAIDRYGIKKSNSARGVPVQFWYYPEFPERIEPTSRYTESMVDFMENELGVNYPWESYSQVMVQDFIYGAMENTTATIFGDFFNVDARAFHDRNYIGVNMHEFTHQWFGDFITARNGNHTWLQESFATHYPKYFFRKIYGEDYFQWQRRMELNSVLDAEKNNRNAIVSTSGGTARVYQKGSAVLDMLRYVLGDEGYRKSIRHYLNKHAYGNVETHDLEVAIHEATGRNLDWFFEEWLYHGGVPEYHVDKELVQNSAGQPVIRFHIQQTHLIDNLTGYFKMPVILEIYYSDGTVDSHTAWVNGSETHLEFPRKNNLDVWFVLFDPHAQIVKKITFNKSQKEWMYQVRIAKGMADRYDALVALRNTPLPDKRETLYRQFDVEPSFFIRAEIVNQLWGDPDPHSLLIIEKSLTDPAVQVRQALINNMKNPDQNHRNILLHLLQDSSYQIVESALDKFMLWYPDEIQHCAPFVSHVSGMANAIHIKLLSWKYISGIKSAIDSLVHYTSSDYEFRTRINAMNALKFIHILNQDAIKNIILATISWNGRLAQPALETLTHFKEDIFYKKMIRDVYINTPWTDKQKKLFTEKNISF